MTAQWYADAERNLRKTVGLAVKPINADHQLGLLLRKAFALTLILSLPSAGPAAAQQAEKPAPSVTQLEAAVKRSPSDPKLHVALGLAYWERDDYPRALIAFQRAVKVAPRSAEAHNWLGVALSEKSDLPGAIAELRKAVALDPKYGRAYTNLGSVLAKSGDFTEAVAVLQKALALEPNSQAAHLNLGMALRDKGDLDAALEHLRPVAAANPTNASIQYELGQTLRQRGDLTDAVGAFEKALEIEPELREAYYALGMALKQQSASLRKPRTPAVSAADDLFTRAQEAAGRGDFNAAREQLAEVLRRDENHAEAHNLLGFILGQQRDLPSALAHLERAVELRPESAEAHYNLGAALWYSGAKDRTLIELQKSVELDPAAGASYAFLGTALRDKGDWAGARSSLQRAIALLPPTTTVYVDLGVTYLRAGDLDKALGQFEAALNLASESPATPDWDSAIAGLRRALAASPGNAEAHNALGLVLGRKGADSNDVASEFREAIRLRPDFAEAHNNLGLVLIQAGDDQAGIAALREAVRVSPDYADAHANLGAALTPTDAGEAIRELEKAVALSPNSVKALFNLAVAYGASPSVGSAKTPGPSKEIDQLRKVIALAPSFGRAHLALGRSLLQDGKVTEAVTELQEAARLEPKSGEAHYQLGLALARAGRNEEATTELQKGRELVAADDRSQNANLDIAEGRAALEKGDLEQATARFRHAIQLRPDSADAQRYLAVVQEKQGDAGKDDPARVAELERYIRDRKFKEVESLLGEYVKERPKSSWGWYALGYSLFAQQKIGDSINALAKSLELDIRNAEAHKILGRSLMVIGRFDAAQIEFEQALRYKPDSAEIHNNLGKLFSVQDNWEPARKAFESALRLDPSHIEALDGLGFALEALGDDAGAVANYDKAIALNEARHGSFASAHVNLSAYYNRTGDSNKALEYARKALELDPRSDRAWFQKGRADEREGRLDEAVKSVNQAISFNPRASSYYYVLAGLYRRLGKMEESRKALEMFKRLEQESSELEKKRRSGAGMGPTGRKRE
jgi:tetratricopeptide (TPR) repeat protein